MNGTIIKYRRIGQQGMTTTKMKSRYCAKCEALYQWQCNCPNHKKYKNIMNRFKEISIEKVALSLKEVGLTGEEHENI